jgi:Asp-tRNA(Asn)/Glu-tRNA(Gln) amidotransferase A subunit family amidase
LADDFDAIGWLTTDVATCRHVAETLLSRTSTTVTRQALVLSCLTDRLAEPVRSAYAVAVKNLLDAEIFSCADDIPLPASVLETWFVAFRTWQAWQAWQNNGAWIAAHPGSLGADVAERFRAAAAITESEALAARDVVLDARSQLRQALDGASLVLPTTAGAAPPLSATPRQMECIRGDTLRLTFIAPLAGAPAVSLPVLSLSESWTAARSPLGLSLIGSPGTDRALLDLADDVMKASRAW